MTLPEAVRADMDIVKKDSENSKNLKRYKEIMSVLNKNGLGFLFVRAALTGPEKALRKAAQTGGGRSIGERLRLSCEELGPTFVKIGQILSTRTDLLPESIANELTKLQDGVAPFSYEEAAHVIETQLEDTIDNIFTYFSREPLAAASMSQVYDARMRDGRHVAVKVQRPNIEEQIDVDFSILHQMANFLDKHTKYGSLYNFGGMVDELDSAMKNELNFLHEGENLDQLRKNMGRNTQVTAPRVVWIYSTKKVLTMDFVEGIKINDVAKLDQVHADKPALAEAFVDELLNEILVYGFFHADPHPGNVMVVDEGTRIEFIDLGMVGRLTPRFRSYMNSFVLGLALQDTRAIAQALMDMDESASDINQYRFSKDLDVILDKYLYVPLNQVNIADVFANIFSLAAEYRMQIPHDMTLVGKALGTAQGIVEALNPKLDILTVAESTVKNVFVKRLITQDFRNGFLSMALDSLDSVRTFPHFLSNFFRKTEDNDFAVQLEIKHLKDLEQGLERMANRVSFTIVLLAICIVMAGIIIGMDMHAMTSGQQAYQMSMFSLETGLILAVLIVVGLVVSIIWTRLHRRKK